MSHSKERKEKNCLNCGSLVYGRYCHICGQENIETKETVWHLITHFFNDITHFDGKFFSSLKYLLLRPGFLSLEYMRGRRASYLHPIRLYVFTSALFFIIFFTFFAHTSDLDIDTSLKDRNLPELKRGIGNDMKRIDKMMAKASYNAAEKQWMQADKALLQQDLTTLETDTLHPDALHYYTHGSPFYSNVNYRNFAQFDSLQQLLQPANRENNLERQLVAVAIKARTKYHNDSNAIIKAILDAFLHKLPQMLFIMLPLFALMLKLLYIRRPQFYYADHGIFSIHLYVAWFIIYLVFMSLMELSDHFSWLQWPGLAVSAFSFFYYYKAMRNFYQQCRAKTVLKFLLSLMISGFLLVFLFIIMLAWSAYTI